MSEEINKKPLKITNNPTSSSSLSSASSDSNISTKKIKLDNDNIDEESKSTTNEDGNEQQIQKCHNCSNIIKDMKEIIEKNQRFYLRIIKDINDENKKNFQQIKKEIENLKNDLISNMEPMPQYTGNSGYLLPDFPLTDSGMFLEFDKLLTHRENEEMLQQMNTFFKCSGGGNDMSNFIRNCLKRIVTDEIACEFSWFGTMEKHPVKDMFIIALIKNICGEQFNSTDFQLMDKVIKSHFQYARDRICKRQRTMAKKNSLFAE